MAWGRMVGMKRARILAKGLELLDRGLGIVHGSRIPLRHAGLDPDKRNDVVASAIQPPRVHAARDSIVLAMSLPRRRRGAAGPRIKYGVMDCREFARNPPDN